jgi:hypothetical protein
MIRAWADGSRGRSSEQNPSDLLSLLCPKNALHEDIKGSPNLEARV